MTIQRYPYGADSVSDPKIEEVQSFTLVFSFTDAAEYGSNLYARFAIVPSFTDRGMAMPRAGEISRITLQSQTSLPVPSSDSGVRFLAAGSVVGTTHNWDGTNKVLDASPSDWLFSAGDMITFEYVDGIQGPSRVVGYAEINFRRGGQEGG